MGQVAVEAETLEFRIVVFMILRRCFLKCVYEKPENIGMQS